jgi:hypothetical protein
MRAMESFACHDCGVPLEPDEELWRAPEDGSPDDGGEPYCPACATPLGIAA